MKIEKKLDVLDWMKIHYLDRECLNKPEKKELDNFVNELKEAINYTHCCTELKDKETLTFDDWCEKYVSVQGENIYLYNKTSYSLFKLMMVYKKIKELNL